MARSQYFSPFLRDPQRNVLARALSLYDQELAGELDHLDTNEREIAGGAVVDQRTICQDLIGDLEREPDDAEG
jgi:hypothetical protein